MTLIPVLSCRDRVCEQLIVKPIQPAINAYMFGNGAAPGRTYPRIILTQVPNEPVSDGGSVVSSVTNSSTTSNESQYPGMQKLPYIAPDAKFMVRQDFLDVLRTLDQVKKHQTEFEYQEVIMITIIFMATFKCSLNVLIGQNASCRVSKLFILVDLS